MNKKIEPYEVFSEVCVRGRGKIETANKFGISRRQVTNILKKYN